MTNATTITPHRQLQIRYSTGALSLAAVLGVGCLLAGWPAAGKGIVLGTVFSAANFILMGEGVALKFATGGGSSLIAFLMMIGRYILLALPIIVAIKQPAFDLPATVAGVFMVQACIIIDAFRKTLKERRQSSA
ncbi:MAG: hypothetical protein ABIL58_04860 [Pseudomonadota bacterium]